ncbi:hypothetical protein FHS94_003474 [Sphingomonas aerophila]|uniref:Transposase InsH N-terminal domain-containing protein n=1 Tax=Sphingomonas aerophila TaxID=1344948 RepID=A0A7W9BG30_9SPHN|nr:hypothetical protein [Sphingomonas aerophila]
MAQEALFYSVSLERHVPADHLLRSIDRFVDLSDIREELKPFYSETGRPSIEPELMIRMLKVVSTARYTHLNDAAMREVCDLIGSLIEACCNRAFHKPGAHK